MCLNWLNLWMNWLHENDQLLSLVMEGSNPRLTRPINCLTRSSRTNTLTQRKADILTQIKVVMQIQTDSQTQLSRI